MTICGCVLETGEVWRAPSGHEYEILGSSPGSPNNVQLSLTFDPFGTSEKGSVWYGEPAQVCKHWEKVSG